MSKTKTTTTPLVDTSLQIEKLEDQIKILDGNWKRALADYQNLLRRVDQDKKEFLALANANLIARLLPSLDIIDLAAAHSQDLGVQMAAKQFTQALTEEGLATIIPELGSDFNPSHHECTQIEPADSNHKPDTIAEIVLKGYKLKDFVLRPARVKVYRTLEPDPVPPVS